MTDQRIAELEQKGRLGYYAYSILSASQFEELPLEQQSNDDYVVKKNDFFYVYRPSQPYNTFQEFLMVKQLKLLGGIRNGIIALLLLTFVIPMFIR